MVSRRSYPTAKKDKCEFMMEEVDFLGHTVSKDGVKMMDDKVKAIAEWPTPTCVKELQSFLGTTNFYRKFIRGYSSITAPLTELFKQDRSFEWNAICQSAFD